MNKKRLEILLNKTVNAVKAHESALSSLEDFCEKEWGTTFHEIQSDMDVKGDHIVEWLDYGNGTVDVQSFIKFMEEHSQKTIDRNCLT